MQFFNKIKKITEARNWLGLAIVGLLIAAICGTAFVVGSRKNSEKINAVVTDIEYDETEEQAISAVYVDYTVDGVAYQHVALSSWSSDLEIGQTVECKYDPENPSDIGTTGSTGLALIIGAVGLLAFVFGLVKLISVLKTPSSEYEQFNRVSNREVDPALAEAIRSSSEQAQNYVWHFTGKLNQSYVMEDEFGAEVYRANCEKLTLVRDTAYDFTDMRSGASDRKMISHTVSVSEGAPLGFRFRVPIKSAFKLDGVNCWDYLAELGYGFDFSLRGLTGCYEVNHYGVPVAHIEDAGTEVLNEKYQGNPLAKLPTKGIYRISCRPSDIPAVFMIAFCLTRIEIFANH